MKHDLFPPTLFSYACLRIYRGYTFFLLTNFCIWKKNHSKGKGVPSRAFQIWLQKGDANTVNTTKAAYCGGVPPPKNMKFHKINKELQTWPPKCFALVSGDTNKGVYHDLKYNKLGKKFK